MTIPSATPLSRIARFAVPAFLIGVLVCVVASGLADLPYPIASDLDSSYLAFFSIAGNRGSVAGVDYVFTYGPLAHWYLPIHFDAALVCGVALRAVTALLAVVVCCSGSTVRRGLLLSVGVVYVMLLDHNAPIVVTLLMLAFSLAARRWVLVLLLVALATVWGLVKFSAVVGIYLCLGYFLFVSIVSGRSYGRNTVLVFAVSTFVHIAVVAGVYVFYLDQSPLYFLDYIDRSFEIAQGYSQFMRSGDRRWSLIGYLVVVAAVFVGHAVSLRANGVPAPAADGRRWSGPDWRGLALASCVAPALFIAMKQGYTRQDGHEVAGYIAAFVYASLVAGSVRLPGRVVVPVQVMIALAVALGVQATQAQDPWKGADAFSERLAGSWERARAVLVLVDEEARAAAGRRTAERNRAALAELRRAVPLVPELENYDIFGPEQALALLNAHEYRPRPIFQGYSAYTPTLQDLNAEHVERVPEQFLVDFGVIDDRYPNLDDGSALAQIAMQFCPDEWYGSHLAVRRAEPSVPLSDLDALDWREGGLISGNAIELPPGVVLGRVQVELTLLGRLAAAVYRLPEIVARITLSDGRTRYARLIPSGSRYPVILSPWLGSTRELAGLWAGAPGDAIATLQLQTSSVLRLLVSEVSVQHASFDWSGNVRKCEAAPALPEPPPAGAVVYELPGGISSLQGIDAHPDRVVAIPVAQLSRFRATLGLRSPALTSARSDGVDVRIYGYRRGEVTPILDRRVSPSAVPTSPTRWQFDGETAADGGYLVLETRDRDHSWDWFEWKSIEFDRSG